MNSAIQPQLSKYRLSRRGRKLQKYDDQRTLPALPKDVPERTWAEILQREENDLIVFDIRDEIVEDALRICYDNYMQRQTTFFTAHVAAQAWLKLIDWYFYRHDPGEDPSAHPPCFIPKRMESWMPDDLPEPSPKDTWCLQQLNVVEDTSEEAVLQAPTSSSSLEYPVIDEIPQECWFPGKVNLPHLMVKEEPVINESITYYGSRYKAHHGLLESQPSQMGSHQQDGHKQPPVPEGVRTWESVRDSPLSNQLGADSELLQKVTNYSTEELSRKESAYSALKTTTPAEGSLHGAGDCAVKRPRRRTNDKSKTFSKGSVTARSRGALPPLDVGESRSRISVISDCRLRNLRLDTQYEISSEKVDTPPGEMVKRK